MPLDAHDFIALYDRHSAALLRWVQQRTLVPELSIDLVAETFAAAFARRSQFRGGPEDRDAAAAWLWSIARSELIDALRRGNVERRALSRIGVERRALTDEEHDRIEDLAGSEDLRARVARALQGLPEDQRRAVHLRVVDELPYRVLAEHLAIPEPTARARVSRGLRAIREQVAHTPDLALGEAHHG